MSRISMVFQDVYLFQDSIRNNIRFGKSDATDEEIVAAAKKGLLSQLYHASATWLRYNGGRGRLYVIRW